MAPPRALTEPEREEIRTYFRGTGCSVAAAQRWAALRGWTIGEHALRHLQAEARGKVAPRLVEALRGPLPDSTPELVDLQRQALRVADSAAAELARRLARNPSSLDGKKAA